MGGFLMEVLKILGYGVLIILALVIVWLVAKFLDLFFGGRL